MIKQLKRDWNRLYLLNGKRLKFPKRPYLGYCELCGAVEGARSKYLEYHRWDDAIPEAGIWCCKPCHIIAEGVEAELNEEGIVQSYLTLKAKITEVKSY